MCVLRVEVLIMNNFPWPLNLLHDIITKPRITHQVLFSTFTPFYTAFRPSSPVHFPASFLSLFIPSIISSRAFVQTQRNPLFFRICGRFIFNDVLNRARRSRPSLSAPKRPRDPFPPILRPWGSICPHFAPTPVPVIFSIFLNFFFLCQRRVLTQA